MDIALFVSSVLHVHFILCCNNHTRIF